MTERESRTIHQSRLELAEIIGDEGQAGQRMQAGRILALMDLVAARVAQAHCQTPVATLMFDRVDLTHQVLHQDLISLSGHLVAVGNSSMTVEVQGRRMDAVGRAFGPLTRSYVTIVSVDLMGRSNKNIPTLRLTTPEEETWHLAALARRDLAKIWEDEQAQVDAQGTLLLEEVEDPLNRDKTEYLNPADTVITIRRQFMPRHMNVMGTIFGGEILLWMDRLATYTARHFTRNRHMVTIAMNRILFKQPIFPTDLVKMTARVVYVRRYTLEVEIEVEIQRLDGTVLPSHSGYFTVLNYDESGFKRHILTGLKLANEQTDDLRRYQKARVRHQFWAARQESLSAEG